jgi:hypothetical protein
MIGRPLRSTAINRSDRPVHRYSLSGLAQAEQSAPSSHGAEALARGAMRSATHGPLDGHTSPTPGRPGCAAHRPRGRGSRVAFSGMGADPSLGSLPARCRGRPETTLHGVRFFAGEVSDAYLVRADIQRGLSMVVWRGRHVAEPTELTDREAGAYGREVLLSAARSRRSCSRSSSTTTCWATRSRTCTPTSCRATPTTRGPAGPTRSRSRPGSDAAGAPHGRRGGTAAGGWQRLIDRPGRCRPQPSEPPSASSVHVDQPETRA